MKLYYYLNAQNEQQGPVELEKLLSCGVTRETLVWTEGMPQWQNAGEVADLLELFTPQSGAVPPPPPPPLQSANEQVPPVNPQPQNNYSQNNYSQNNYAQNNYAQNNTYYRPKPENWLVFSVLSTVLCCMPFGVVALVYACKVDGLWKRGAYDEADRAARKARTFCLISLILGILSCILAVIFAILGDGGSETFQYIEYQTV